MCVHAIIDVSSRAIHFCFFLCIEFNQRTSSGCDENPVNANSGVKMKKTYFAHILCVDFNFKNGKSNFSGCDQNGVTRIKNANVVNAIRFAFWPHCQFCAHAMRKDISAGRSQWNRLTQGESFGRFRHVAQWKCYHYLKVSIKYHSHITSKMYVRVPFDYRDSLPFLWLLAHECFSRWQTSLIK